MSNYATGLLKVNFRKRTNQTFKQTVSFITMMHDEQEHIHLLQCCLTELHF